MKKIRYEIKNTLFSVCIIFLISHNAHSQLNIPNVRSYNQSIDLIFVEDSTSQKYNQYHLSFKPLLKTKTNSKKIFDDQGDYYYWITQKLFKEHFLVFSGKTYFCSVDPIIDVQIGGEQYTGNSNINLRTWNTRGIRIQTSFFDNFAFETNIYENQATLLSYQSDYANAHGEFIKSGNKYKQHNATIPRYARTKPFKDGGYDFAFAEGYFSYTPATWLNIQAGNGNHFIGNGYRSLLLSDFSTNYPYFKPEFTFLNDRIQYTLTYALLQNSYRLIYFNTPEANYEKKLGTFNYVDFVVSKNFQIGLFEGGIWHRSDSLGTDPINFQMLNPLIGTNALLSESKKYNTIFGVNMAYQLANNKLYSQLVLDQKKISGIQIGVQSYNIINNLHAQIEYNYSGSNTYLNSNKRLNYSHSNLALAHPYSNNFQELVVLFDYSIKRFFAHNTFNYAKKLHKNNEVNLSPILTSTQVSNTNIVQHVAFNQLELGYRFNKKYNLEFVIGHLFRISTVSKVENTINYSYFGLRTNLNNKNLDW